MDGMPTNQWLDASFLSAADNYNGGTALHIFPGH
jgi:hypothetical protein